MKKEEELELEFRRGYYCAVANLVSMHGEGIEAVEVLRTYGEINFDGISEYDKEKRKKSAEEVARFASNTLRSATNEVSSSASIG